MYSVEDNTDSVGEDLFKESFKKYKSRKNDIDLSEVVDFTKFQPHNHCRRDLSVVSGIQEGATAGDGIAWDQTQVKLRHLSCVEDATNCDLLKNCYEYGLKPYEEWRVFEHNQVPGLLFIQDPFLDSLSKNYWIDLCLKKYHVKPNVCNLDAHCVQENNLWSDFVESMKKGGKLNRTDFYKLRWVTIGYHYDWNTKKYNKYHHSEFPSELCKLSNHLAQCLGYSYFSPEAGIINYYHLDSTLAGHTDHSEYDMNSPLFSVSFGCDAIFLIGGETKATRPVPIYLRSGDIIVMAGKSRLAYHAVPKIIKQSCTLTMDHDLKQSENDDHHNYEKNLMQEYMSCSRININIRQVLKEGEDFPD